ncbi:RNA polymerase sigma factor [Mobiluncus curtisii]|uniref:RNA polymerase sigma factor n=1 Tax=Mobiluncus curtisii TaxID=2051 RepID=UPI000DFC2305|nr:sigma-70 family RNA polymerase sigma factor [Mobiluncus curtisii]QQT12949.1 sigma-70 family RNA polymerase sigma factor [Mobiluncus curtisii]STY77461.1 Uncharacterised protein [Mobiluncus curtisii subsp. curtisii]
MAISTSQPQPRPYASRCKTDSNGQEHWHLYVPSAKGWAWIELFDLPEPDEALKEEGSDVYAASVERANVLREQILNPDYQADWKIAWAQDAYKRFRDYENARKRGDTSYSDWEIELPADRALYAVNIEDPEEAYLRAEAEEESQRILAEILLPLNPRQRKYVTLSLGEGMSYADIARSEHPDADQVEINKLADAVRNSVNRAVKRIHKMFGPTRPDSPRPEDV